MKKQIIKTFAAVAVASTLSSGCDIFKKDDSSNDGGFEQGTWNGANQVEYEDRTETYLCNHPEKTWSGC